MSMNTLLKAFLFHQSTPTVKAKSALLKNFRGLSYCCSWYRRKWDVTACNNRLETPSTDSSWVTIRHRSTICQLGFGGASARLFEPLPLHDDFGSSITFRLKRRQLSSDTEDRLHDSSTDEETLNSSENMSRYIVGHDKSNKLFYITLQAQTANRDAALAKLDYDWVRPNLVDLYHTEVPPEFQGQGIAKLLAQAAFDYFCEQEIHFRPSCTYLQKYLRDNPVPRYLDNMDKTQT